MPTYPILVVCNLDKRILQSLDLNGEQFFFMKLFKTSNIDMYSYTMFDASSTIYVLTITLILTLIESLTRQNLTNMVHNMRIFNFS